MYIFYNDNEYFSVNQKYINLYIIFDYVDSVKASVYKFKILLRHMNLLCLMQSYIILNHDIKA